MAATIPGIFGLPCRSNNENALNAALQLILRIEPLRNHFLTGAYAAEINLQNKLGTKGELANAVASLAQAAWNPNHELILSSDDILKVVHKFNPHLVENGGDLQEVFNLIQDSIHEDLNRVKNPPYIPFQDDLIPSDLKVNAAMAWEKYKIRNDSIISDNLIAQMVGTTKCDNDSCPVRPVFDPMGTLSLNIPKNVNECSLQDCFDLFTAPEKVDTADWFCSSCKKLQMCTRNLAVWNSNEYFIVSFKRITYNKFWQKEKVSTFVQYPVKGLDIANFLLDKPGDQSTVYDLVAVGNHMGSAIRGHYYTYVKDDNSEQWFRISDEKVSPIDDVVTKDAYMLIYKRRPLQ